VSSTPRAKAIVLAAIVAIVVFAGTAHVAAPSPPRTVRIAVLDTGVDPHLPQLAGRLTAARSFVSGARGSDASWHGTAVAGVLAAGVCSRCTIVSARVLDADESGNDLEIARALLWAVAAGARVVNLSMSGSGEAPALRDAIRAVTRRGVVVVAAAGNDGSSAQRFPAADPNVIGVAATDRSGALAAWSNRGSWIAVAAPGEAPGLVGTSAAAPAVASAAAECLTVSPGLSPKAVRAILVRTASRLSGMPFGRLDEGRAVRMCAAA
jgi:subtilisin family serine protease